MPREPADPPSSVLVCPNCGAPHAPSPGTVWADCPRCDYPLLRPDYVREAAIQAWQRQVLPRRGAA